MRMILALVAAIVWAGVAGAADKPSIGPRPAWVKPVAIPPLDGKLGEAPVRILLQDQQVAIEAGRQSVYSQMAMRIQTPQGLAAGNVSLAWRPETSELTVHRLLIHRGDQVIDVLGSGQTFTVVRRETNLESAMLDGLLTANIQPEGLQVGDVLYLEATTSSADPVLKGHVEQIGGGWDGLPVARAHLRMQWPSTMPIRLRQTESLPALKQVKNGDTTSVELSLENLEPINFPKGAPPRFQIGRLVELTDFASWADLATLMAPLYRTAATLPTQGPLQAELARIKALSPDPVIRAEAALALVQDRVRYVALSMGEGGLVPADAETTWSRRFGDCKGKTALLIALLHALDIQAEPVAVNASGGDGMDERLPMIALFNHVLVRATIGGRTYWLDGTRTGDKKLGSIQTPSFGWGLPLVPTGASLVRIMPQPLQEPTQTVTVHIDATGGLTAPAPAKVETVLRGDQAVVMNMGLASLTPDARDRALREYWKEQYDFIDVKATNATFDAERREQRLSMEGMAKMDWSRGGYYLTNATDVGYVADFSREPGPNRDAPFEVAYPYFNRAVETILLPAGFGTFNVDKIEIDQTVGGIEYRRQATLKANVFRVEKNERSIAPEFPATNAPAAQAALKELAGRSVLIRIPSTYRPTEKDVTAALESTPSTAAGFVKRGNMLLDLHRFDEAIADFDRALALDPKEIWALADRGLARVWKGDNAAAEKDLAAAAAIDPRNPVVFRAHGLMAERNGVPAEAIAAYTSALEIEPNNMFALMHRAEAHRAAGDDERALADAAAAIKLRPRAVDAYLLRANLFQSQGKKEQGIAEAAALSAANPDDGFAHVAAAKIYAAFQKTDEAMREFDRAIAIKPEAYIYVNRSEVRPKEDLAGRRSDIEAALRLDPKSADAIAAKASLQEDSGDLPGAIASWTAAVSAYPEDSKFLVRRGIAYARAGRPALSEKDFEAARTHAADAAALNNLCWTKATAGVALESALADCDAAIGKAPDRAGYLDSRALVLLRLGRLDEAIAEYDRALAKQPDLAPSLFGRAIAWSRKGEKPRAEADAAAAEKVNPKIRDAFKQYGITL